MPLTDAKCRAAKPADKPYKLTDSGALYLFVTKAGSRLWRMNYSFAGKQKTLSFGPYPEVSLSDARRKRDEAKEALEAGVDPATGTSADGQTFEAVARTWIEMQAAVWTPAYHVRVVRRFEADIYPSLGSKPIGKIDPLTVLAVLRRIEDRGALETARRMRQHIDSIFSYAVVSGFAKINPAADLVAGLRPKPKPVHMARLREDELAEFFKRLDRYDTDGRRGDTLTKLAIEFTVYTFVRTNEIRFARWSEFEGDIWRIPAERMKMRREHIVPLTPRTLAILERMREVSHTGEFVCKMSENTMIYALYRMGYHSRATIHGFRATASTILNESLKWPKDVIEMQLAHAEEDKVRAAYNSAQYLPQRCEMMQWYSDRLDALRL